MSSQNKTKKIIIKIPRHPYIMTQDTLDYQERMKVRKCRVNLERLKSHHDAEAHPFSFKPKEKRCCVRVARLPNVDRRDISATPASSIVCSDFDRDSE